jgi:hypothetical protein
MLALSCKFIYIEAMNAVEPIRFSLLLQNLLLLLRPAR